MGFFEQALSALSHLPETRTTREQAIDLRLALRSALYPSGDWERILVTLREAESLAAALDDPRRLVQVSLFLSRYFSRSGIYDQAMAAAARALALTTASGEVALHAQANYYLGISYKAQGNHPRAIDCFAQTVASLEGARRDESFGQALLPAVSARSYLAESHAELGAFAQGRVLGEEGLQIAEAIARLGSLIFAYRGVGLLALRQGDLPGALSLLERAVGMSGRGLSGLVSPNGCDIGGGVYSGRTHHRGRAITHAGGGTDDCTGNGRLSGVLHALPGGGTGVCRSPGGGASCG
jgi:hypothetical protein